MYSQIFDATHAIHSQRQGKMVSLPKSYCCTQHGKLTCTVMTVILKMMGRKYRAYMSKRAPRAADSSPRMRQACLETADRLQHASNDNDNR